MDRFNLSSRFRGKKNESVKTMKQNEILSLLFCLECSYMKKQITSNENLHKAALMNQQMCIEYPVFCSCGKKH